MGDKMEGLELRSKELCRRLSRLGDFRRGTIALSSRRCVKKNCACAQAAHPGHSEVFVEYDQEYSQRGANSEEWARVGEVYEGGRQLPRVFGSDQGLIEVNENICDLRPPREVEDEEKLALKKIAAEVCQEAEQEIEQMVKRLMGGVREAKVDWEASEHALRQMGQLTQPFHRLVPGR